MSPRLCTPLYLASFVIRDLRFSNEDQGRNNNSRPVLPANHHMLRHHLGCLEDGEGRKNLCMMMSDGKWQEKREGKGGRSTNRAPLQFIANGVSPFGYYTSSSPNRDPSLMLSPYLPWSVHVATVEETCNSTQRSNRECLGISYLLPVLPWFFLCYGQARATP